MRSAKEWITLFNEKIKEEYPQDYHPQGFLKFCLKIFYNVSDGEIEEAVENLGSNDQGLDAYLVDDDVHYLVQSKYSENHKNFKAESGDRLSQLEKQIKNEDFNLSNIRNLNQRVREIAEELREAVKDGEKIQKVLFTFGGCSEQNVAFNSESNIKVYTKDDIIDKFKSYINSLEETIEEERWEEEEETDGIEKTHSMSITPSNKNDSISIYFFHPSERDHKEGKQQYGHIITKTKLSGNNQEKQSLVGIISSDQLVKMRDDVGDGLFDQNVRDFLGRNEVNKGIIETVTSKPEEFLAFNNGIHIICKKIEDMGVDSSGRHGFSLTDPKVVNGAQTVGSLYEAAKDFVRKNKCDDRFRNGKFLDHFRRGFVMCKIIETATYNSGFYSNMTVYSNKNNKIEAWDFASKDKEPHKKIKDFFMRRGLYYTYKRSARIGQKALKEKSCSKQIALQTLSPIYLWSQGALNAQKSNVFKVVEGNPCDSYQKFISAPPWEIFLSNIVYDICDDISKEVKICASNYFSTTGQENTKELLYLSFVTEKKHNAINVTEKEKESDLEKIRKMTWLLPKTLTYMIFESIKDIHHLNDELWCEENMKDVVKKIIETSTSKRSQEKYKDLKTEIRFTLSRNIKCCFSSFNSFLIDTETTSKPSLSKQNLEALKESMKRSFRNEDQEIKREIIRNKRKTTD